MKNKTLQFKNWKLEKKDLFYDQRSKIWYGVYYVSKGKWDNSWAAAHACRILYTTDTGSIHRGNSIPFTREYLHLWTTEVFYFLLPVTVKL